MASTGIQTWLAAEHRHTPSDTFHFYRSPRQCRWRFVSFDFITHCAPSCVKFGMPRRVSLLLRTTREIRTSLPAAPPRHGHKQQKKKQKKRKQLMIISSYSSEDAIFILGSGIHHNTDTSGLSLCQLVTSELLSGSDTPESGGTSLDLSSSAVFRLVFHNGHTTPATGVAY